LPEVVAPFGAYFVRDRCVCHDLDRSHAEFKPDETKKTRDQVESTVQKILKQLESSRSNCMHTLIDLKN